MLACLSYCKPVEKDLSPSSSLQNNSFLLPSPDLWGGGFGVHSAVPMWGGGLSKRDIHVLIVSSFGKIFQQVRKFGSLRTQGATRSKIPQPLLQNSLVVSAGRSQPFVEAKPKIQEFQASLKRRHGDILLELPGAGLWYRHSVSSGGGTCLRVVEVAARWMYFNLSCLSSCDCSKRVWHQT